MNTDGRRATAENSARLSVPLEFLQALSDAATEDQLYDAIATWLPTMFPTDRISLALPQDKDHLRVVAFSGGNMERLDEVWPIEGTRLGECFLTREPVIKRTQADVHASAEDTTDFRSDFQSVAMIPLLTAGTCVGTLNFGSSEANAFGPEIVDDLTKIASWIALQLSRRDAQEHLKASEARFNALIENAGSIIFAKTVDGEILLANETYCETLGRPREQIVGRTETDLFGAKNTEIWRQQDKRIIESMEGETNEGLLDTADGPDRNFVTQKFPVFDPARGEHIICAISTDISEQKRIKNALAESEQRARAFFDNSPSMMFMKDTDHRLSFVNRGFLEFYGTTEEDVLGKKSAAYVPPDVLEKFEAEDRKIVEQGIKSELEVQMRDRDGNLRDFFAVKFPVTDADGKPVALGGINIDVTELRTREKQLEAATEEAVTAARNFERAARQAQEADLAKTEFLASMSHELRTPLAGMLGMAHLLMDDDPNDEQRQKIETIRASGNALLTILNDILDLSKIEAGSLDIEERDFNLIDVVAGIENLWKPQILAKDLDWSCEIAADLAPALLSDEVRLRQVAFNLISNALKFTESGRISLNVSQTGETPGRVTTRFEITDSGPGIPPALEESLFEKFTQADSSIARRYGGTGLGLAICRSLVELMGGDIGYESAIGRGTTFWFTVSSAPGTAARSNDAGKDGPDAAGHSGGSLNILVAEDNEVNQQIVRLMLERAGHRCTMVDNGLKAVAIAKKTTFDLVLMDVQMPEMDGITATRQIRKIDGPARQVPIIALTANAMKGDRENYLEAGMNDYVSKPVEPALLGAAIARQTETATELAEIVPPTAGSRPDDTIGTDADLRDEIEALFDGLDFDSDK